MRPYFHGWQQTRDHAPDVISRVDRESGLGAVSPGVRFNAKDSLPDVEIANQTKGCIERLGILLTKPEIPFEENWQSYITEKTPQTRWGKFLEAVLRNTNKDVHREHKKNLSPHEKRFNQMSFSKVIEIIMQFYLKRLFGENNIVIPSPYSDVKQFTDAIIIYEKDRRTHFLSADITTANLDTAEGQRVFRMKTWKLGEYVEIPEFGKITETPKGPYINRHQLKHIIIHADGVLWKIITKTIYDSVAQGKIFDPDEVLKTCAGKWLQENNSPQVKDLSANGEKALESQMTKAIDLQLAA